MNEPVTIGDATLYLADCLEILPTLGKFDAVVTDPVWPNCPEGLLPGANGTQIDLLRNSLLNLSARTIVITLGFNSDPRFLMAVPGRWPFIRSQCLPYAIPGRCGRLLGGDEMAYAFGEIPKGRGLIPGRAPAETEWKSKRATGHPCPRSDRHTTSLVGWWSNPGETVVDQFMGTASTGVACVNLGRKFIGIEIEPKYFDIACERIEAAYAQGRLFA